ncbi:hypothetical protein [Calothrix sp. NIES-3974]|uniref:hypothetical protein n=1 Tax=Calothrix sp. NIES-3974 TaxID=2005462 RepID=UPI0012FE5434|nr:hypothetical protein [Calothrix sp. NIES-3974]
MNRNLQNMLMVVFFVFAIAFFSPIIEFPSAKAIAFTQPIDNLVHSNQDRLTPLAHQEIQAVRQRRNRDIIEVLDQSQRAELDYYVRSGEKIESAVTKLSLDRDQWDTIQAIVELSRLKTKAILARHGML